MKLKSRATFAASLIAAACMFAAGGAHAAATITNTAGTLALGINDEGHLNTAVGSVALNSSSTGLAFNMGPATGRPAGFYDATSPGCFCEGWGVSVNNLNSGYANVSTDGVVNLSAVSFASGANSATSVTSLTDLPGITVTHAYSEADNAPGALFKAVVTIKNTTGATVNDLKYVRVMDWDVPFTEFFERVTIRGTATTSYLERSHDNGFNTANPLGGDGSINPTTENVDFVDEGPADHGAYFRFNFGSLAADAEFTFTIFYGATDSERTALAAIAAEGIELYSLGQSGACSPSPSFPCTPGDPVAGTPATFIFGFKGVGGVPVELPTPGSLALVGLGLLGAGALRRRRA